jgi:hypothetical protein
MENTIISRVERFYTPKAKTVWKGLGIRPEKESMLVEHVYFDTGHPTLFYTGFVRGRRVVSADAPLFDDDALFQMESRKDDSEPTEVHEERMTLGALAQVARKSFGLGKLSPMFGLRFERQSGEGRGLRIDADHDTTYFSLLGDEPYEVGREESPRMTVRRLQEGVDDAELDALLESLDKAPCTAKKWMGFHFVKTCYELPRFDELAGYEYEVKLDVDSLNFDLGLLPFPVLEVYQSDSLRRYYKKYRACLRGDSAHLVEKGPVQSIGGVLKRLEVKKRGMMAWNLPEPKMVMRRYKREVNVLNPDTGRVYTLSLHHCDAGDTFQQVEIEYDGRLVPGAVTLMARFMTEHRTDIFQTLGARADAAGWGELGNSLRRKYLMLAGEEGNADLVASTMVKEKSSDEVPTVDPVVEEEVIDDMIVIRDSLLRQGMRPSRLTKRKWLRRVYAERVE